MVVFEMMVWMKEADYSECSGRQMREWPAELNPLQVTEPLLEHTPSSSEAGNEELSLHCFEEGL